MSPARAGMIRVRRTHEPECAISPTNAGMNQVHTTADSTTSDFPTIAGCPRSSALHIPTESLIANKPDHQYYLILRGHIIRTNANDTIRAGNGRSAINPYRYRSDTKNATVTSTVTMNPRRMANRPI